MSLKQKTIKGLTWSFIDNFSNQGIVFLVGIILARLLSPKEYGLIGMITIFIAISQSFIDSGFSDALIQKKECSEDDYTTVFYFNLAIGIIFYVLLFFAAGVISNFYNEEKLLLLVRVLGVNLIINSFGVIQRTLRTKTLNFKLQAKISVVSSSFSGILGIGMAYWGCGVWSLVGKTIAQNLCSVVLFWLSSNWKSRGSFSFSSLKELFGFGSRLLLSGLLNTAYKNSYYLIIGKYYSASELGFYTRAEQFKNLPSKNFTGIIQRVTYPVLSSIQDEPQKLKEGYKKLIKSSMLISSILMLGMAAVAPTMILVLIGQKWLPAAVYLQLLCFAAIFYPLHVLNLNMLAVQGRSDLFLRLEIIKKILAVPTIIIGIILGIKIMIIGMIANSLIAYYLNSYWSGKFIGYSMSEQVKDIMPSFLLSAFTGLIVFITGIVLHAVPLVMLIAQITFGAAMFLGICELLKIQDYLYLKDIVAEKIIYRR